MDTAIVLFTRDLRVHDNPALAAACRVARRVVPLFVLDPSIRTGEPRRRFLAGALADLRASLRDRGGDLVLRAGDPVAETVRLAGEVGAQGVAVSRDVSGFAQRRYRRLDAACTEHRLALRAFDGLTVVPPFALKPSGGGDHYRVFTPYWRQWREVSHRPVERAPAKVELPAGLAVGRLPGGAGDAPVPGGETAARRRLAAWSGADYVEGHDDLAGDRTSRLSPYLHFGCLSPRELITKRGVPEEFVRQVCWRDFYHQVCAAFPRLVDTPYRPGAADEWRGSDADFDRWVAGETGVPLVDAGMRQLAAEGWMHNRARLVTASYLTKDLGVDWRRGAAHFMAALVDGDVANNYGNWQWVAGTGNDSRPYRKFNPHRQAERYDASGGYRRRWGV
ncbi:deoxyribodipyrimidine photo-lyase [Pilimelia anulata]|uniref:Deoxyribodipyrimidine photo-lyase n=1 Tax=Pilimelia anulata TaxID=53371 RepID=A0A8J3B4N9_9ACTN|nr:deoxyribodipyrimidine photo-lyase [Pilimelia anulata]GGJ94104.1 deoxyribodipyrimidine photo-lyase [Pilimelia anulata]